MKLKNILVNIIYSISILWQIALADFNFEDGDLNVFSYKVNKRESEANWKLKSYSLYPHVVSIYQDGAFACSGIVLKDKQVITARHCVTEKMDLSVGTSSVTILDSYKIIYRNYVSQLCFFGGAEDVGKCRSVATDNDLDIVVLKMLEPMSLFFDEPKNVEGLHYFETSKGLVDLELGKLIYVGFGYSDRVGHSGVKNRSFVRSENGEGCRTLRFSRCNRNNECSVDYEIFSSADYQCTRNDFAADFCHGDSGGMLAFQDNEIGVLIGMGVRAYRQTNPYCGDGGVFINMTNEEILSWLRGL